MSSKCIDIYFLIFIHKIYNKNKTKKYIMKNLKESLSFAFYCLVVLWIIMIINWSLSFYLNQFGIIPRMLAVRSFVGIFLSPLIHANFSHLISNSLPLFFLLTALMLSYRKFASKVIVLSIFGGGILVWLFARGEASHIGASGLIFALIGFLLSNVLFRRDFRSFLVAVVVGFLYGGAIWGILPSDPNVSWEAHLFGFLTGIYLAFKTRHDVPA
jgi:membrane associated rhomboid family serine protease